MSIEAVSYTHLDVYKRQVDDRAHQHDEAHHGDHGQLLAGEQQTQQTLSLIHISTMMVAHLPPSSRLTEATAAMQGVYSRQNTSSGAACAGAVSYTHLDVYKRQIMPRATRRAF